MRVGVKWKSARVPDGERRAFRWHIRMVKRCRWFPLLQTLVLRIRVMLEAIPARVILYTVRKIEFPPYNLLLHLWWTLFLFINIFDPLFPFTGKVKFPYVPKDIAMEFTLADDMWAEVYWAEAHKCWGAILHTLFCWTRSLCVPDGTAAKGWSLCRPGSGNCSTGVLAQRPRERILRVTLTYSRFWVRKKFLFC